MVWWQAEMPMLKQRVITALIMAGCFWRPSLFLPLPGLALLFGILVGMGAWEWSRLAGWQSLGTRYLCTVSACRLAAAYAVYCQLGDAPIT